MAVKEHRSGLGPGLVVAAAFVGPGTVTTATLAGQGFGTSLLWALVFATLATIVLQDMSARLGAGAGKGLGETLRLSVASPLLRFLLLGLVLAAVLIGNAAYQGGNLAGAALGIEAAGFDGLRRPAVIAVALIAAAVLLPGRYRLLERVLVVIVVMMSGAFLLTFLIAGPPPSKIASGLIPRLPDGSTLTVLALIGTTIVPYNLILHAAAAKARWPGGEGTRQARRDSIVAVALGGGVSAAILLTAAGTASGEGAAGLAASLEPVFGEAGPWLVGLGLLSAGISSAITAPMAAGFVTAELFGRNERHARRLFRYAGLGVLLTGTTVAAFGLRPEALILFTQAANGLLLPVIAIALLLLMNRRDLLGGHRNSAASNIAGAVVVATTVLLGSRGLLRALGVWE
jgi:Mn2+/Fe2+ NRAMP family transporter